MAHMLPPHLRKYAVEQNYEKYTPVDQACWRYILRQLRDFLGKHAHECYIDGLAKTGIDVEKIPRIEEISAKLEQFGWRAIPVSGFIPPAAFMELQALSVLPIASDMRTVDHLLYTPAPDIVHEAAGHAPILIHPEFAAYLKKYSKVAKKAIISKDDLDLYEAIRDLSDIKENPTSTPEDIARAEQHLDKVSKGISHISEATELSRMNWWTAEYGLIGDIKAPKIFGAGLLSSVGESRWCLSEKVKKIPLSVDCIKQGYDITEPQPQLFVTPDFQTLHRVLEEMADNMAFRKGGLESVQKIIKARSVNTVELNSGIQISGICSEVLTDANNQPAYLKFSGPCQLSYNDKEIQNQGCSHHSHGFGTPVGQPQECKKDIHTLSPQDVQQLGWEAGKSIILNYNSGLKIIGTVKTWTYAENKAIILTLENAKATMNDQTLFDPSWGVFDIALGSAVQSVFGGPADRAAFGETDDFVAKKVPTPSYSSAQLERFALYQKIRDLREAKIEGTQLSSEVQPIFEKTLKEFGVEWLLQLEMFELLSNRDKNSALAKTIEQHLLRLAQSHSDLKSVIEDGLRLSGTL